MAYVLGLDDMKYRQARHERQTVPSDYITNLYSCSSRIIIKSFIVFTLLVLKAINNILMVCYVYTDDVYGSWMIVINVISNGM